MSYAYGQPDVQQIICMDCGGVVAGNYMPQHDQWHQSLSNTIKELVKSASRADVFTSTIGAHTDHLDGGAP